MRDALDRHGSLILRYIRLSEAGRYSAEGWYVAALPMPHGAHSMLAWRAG